MPMRYRFREVLASLPPEKRRSDGTVSRFLHRPLSYPVAWALLNVGVTPNQTTYASAFLCVTGLALALVPVPVAHWAAVTCFFAFGTLDCADGTMARTIRARDSSAGSGPWGEWVDALGGYIAYATILIALGRSADLVAAGGVPGPAGMITPGSWTVVGAIASTANLVMRLAFQSFRVVSDDSGRSGVSGEKRLSEEIGITGWLQPLYAVGLATGFLPYVLVAYAAVFVGGGFITVARLAKKAGK